MPSGTLKIVAELNTDGGRVDLLAAIGLASPSEHSEAKVLASGDNTFTRPTSATEALFIRLPPTNAVVTKVKAAAGDATPFALLMAGGFYCIALDPNNLPTNVIVNAASAHVVGQETVVRWF